MQVYLYLILLKVTIDFSVQSLQQKQSTAIRNARHNGSWQEFILLNNSSASLQPVAKKKEKYQAVLCIASRFREIWPTDLFFIFCTFSMFIKKWKSKLESFCLKNTNWKNMCWYLKPVQLIFVPELYEYLYEIIGSYKRTSIYKP